MQSERIQRQVDRLLDEAEAAVAASDWARVRDRAENVLRLDPENPDALTYLAAADRPLPVNPPDSSPPPAGEGEGEGRPPPAAHPTSFVGGRYEVRHPLGEGATKLVYLAHDTKLDRDVAFALIKTDGLDTESLARIRREAQAMARLGDHPHIVAVYDIGDEDGRPYIIS